MEHTQNYSLSAMIGQARKHMWKQPKFLLIPFVLRSLIVRWGTTFFPEIFRHGYGSLMNLSFWYMINIPAVISAVIVSFCMLFVFNITVLAYKKKEHIPSERTVFHSKETLFNSAFKKLAGIFVITIIQWACFYIPMMIGLALLYVNLRLWIVAMLVLGIFGSIMFVKFLFADYYYLLKPNHSIIESCKASMDLVNHMWWWNALSKFLHLMGMCIGVLIISSLVIVPLISLISPLVSSAVISSIVGILYAWTTIIFANIYAHYSTTSSPEREWLGCFFYGFFILIVVLVWWMIVMCMLLARGFDMFVAQWTTDAPLQLPTIEASLQEQKSAFEKVATLWKIFADEEKTSVSFSQDELNTAISYLSWEEGSSMVKDHMYMEIKDNLLLVTFSIPLEAVPQQRLQGKYLNGTLWFTITTQADRYDPIVISLVTGNINNTAIPQEFLTEIAKRNLLESAYQRSYTEQYQWINDIDIMEVRNGKLYIENK